MDADGPTTPPNRTTCAIAGGGPAGLVLGLLLARAGVAVTVLEKHADFLRDFRGDTVHPSTLALLDDLGLFDRFDRIPQAHLRQVPFPGAGDDTVLADFPRLPVRHPYIAMVPQWDLLDLIAEAASEEPSFTLCTEHEVTGVIQDGDRVTGLTYTAPTGDGRILADLTVACDGRHSTVRRAVRPSIITHPCRFDVWWYRIPTAHHVGEALLPRTRAGRIAIAIPRTGYLQVAALGLKDSDAPLGAEGLAALRSATAELLPEVAGDVDALTSPDDVKRLDVRVDRLRRWHRPGVLCIGDAAHAMSPVGGVGINLAVQDAIAAARILAAGLRSGGFGDTAGDRLLARVQRRRLAPTIIIQGLQRVLHAGVIAPVLRGETIRPPRLLVGALRRFPALSVVPAFLIGIGPRPERAPVWARRPAPSRRRTPSRREGSPDDQ